MPRLSTRKRQVVSYDNDTNGAAPKTTHNLKTDVRELVTKTVGKRKLDSATEGEEGTQNKTQAKRPKAKAKAKATAEDSTMKLAERTTVSSLAKAMYIGAHVSAAGGVQNAVSNAVQIGANSFALFLKSQRKWDNPPISTEARDLFIGNCKEHGYAAAEHALPHGSYLVNLAQADESKAAQAYKSFVDDLERCEQLGIKLYNFHPGSTGGGARPAAIGRIAAQLNRSHKATKSVITVLENMAGAGNVIGSTWEDLRDIIALVEQKDRVGVCIDTCHAFAAGHDLRTAEAFEKTMKAFDEAVGYEYLKAFHLNDSKAPFKSNRDLHANIGTGFLGLRAFHCIMNFDGFRGMPMVLETPIDKKGPDGKTVEDKQIWADEIKLLESLIGMNPESNEFKEKEQELQVKGVAERSRIQDQVDKKSVKDAKKGSRVKSLVKPRKKGQDSGEESD
ncbi:DNA lyase [Metarhizium album ARSEF 1941]|uniref:Apurinic-apyrimidinic endonuclease 1 n=1 Tax=Metarhizium album (strain ARSEF 1941) TaxID=1081103 RepID=A0A0B2WYA1_METAS|nr:DNA lyase [Metarhizium album ARSEF 1941]KHN98574.1 DNA lyase [Metarhizium album ARSEF 1941]